jgi:hypothetical protein
MNPNNPQHSSAWVSFTYANMLVSLGLMLGGILFLPLDMWIKGYMLMGVAMLVSSSITVTKTVRDIQEAGKLVNKIEDAKTEQLLMRMERGKE